jgi:hypothetical protein
MNPLVCIMAMKASRQVNDLTKVFGDLPLHPSRVDVEKLTGLAGLHKAVNLYESWSASLGTLSQSSCGRNISAAYTPKGLSIRKDC